MRLCAGLALSVAGALALTPSAGATTYCNDPSTARVPECTPAASPRQALDMAKANPGFDTVVLGAASYDVADGLVYSDDGAADNGLLIESRMHCPDRYTCNHSTLRGGAPGAPVLSLSAPGGSDVRVRGVRLQPAPGAIGLALGAGARAEGVNVTNSDTAGIRLEGTPSMPAMVSNSSATGAPAVDVPGNGIVENTTLLGILGVRGHTGGSVDIRGGGISAFKGVAAAAARITGTAITFAEPGYPDAGGSPVGVEAACADAGSPDAGIEIVSATIAARSAAGASGVLAKGRGGDGNDCDVTVGISSSIVHNADVSLDARGEAGSGTDPRDGSARIDVSYSDYRAAAATVSGPAMIESATPGHNVDTDPAFAAPGWLAYPLLWSSSLIDAGSPVPPEEWQRPYLDVVHGRRDIGEFEYGFQRPELRSFASPAKVATGTPADLIAAAHDADMGDPLELVWTLPDGTTSSEENLKRSFRSIGRYRFRLQATDPTGQTSQAQVTVRVLRQVLTDLRVRPARFRPSERRDDPRGAEIRFGARAADTVDFRVHRATRRRGSPRLRWRRVPGQFEYTAFALGVLRTERAPFNGWVGTKRLRPGLYRLTARGRGQGEAARTRFRIVR